MKRKPRGLLKKAGICAGTVAVSAALLTGCDWFRPEENEPVCVYGPPEYFEDDYDPAQNQEEDVYGPPLMDDDDYDPSEDIPAPVYGPPDYIWEQGEP